MRTFGMALFAALLMACFSAPTASAQSKKAESFSVGDKTFLLNGKPFVVKAAEMHYPRIPREYWDHRIKMCKALGMNTVCIYVFWNIHEPQPGAFDFTGNNDLAAFCRVVQDNGMYVIVRPGPYVCAEWEMGGLPWWLLKKKDIKLRDMDPYFMERVKLFENEVGKQLVDLQISKGGNILMVQVENEYGSYGENKEYVSAIRDIVKGAGFTDVPLFQCDWSSNFTKNGLDDLVWTMNFGTGANIDNQFRKLLEMRPNSPLMCSEFWSGWFDKWGARHETRPAKDMVDGMREMLEKNISFSLYMTHGGTSFAHWAGANSPGFAPDVTSYDYDAPISEPGWATPKYWELRRMMADFMDGKKQANVPKVIPTISFPEVKFTQSAKLFDNLPAPIETRDIKSMEEFDQGWGSMLYRTTLPEVQGQSKLVITEAHDWAQIFIDGKLIGTLDRRMGDKELVLPSIRKGAQLDILIEAMGRINFGVAIKDFKGITQKVELISTQEGHEVTANLKNWKVYLLPASYDFNKNQKYTASEGVQGPGFYRATFKLNKVGDTFIDMQHFGKGLVWVNGHGMGRFWEIGPQQTLYMPGCWLKKGENEIIIFDIKGPRAATVEGLEKPQLDMLLNNKPATHREAGQNLNLTGETAFFTSAFAPGNGWQEAKFQPVTGRYICIEALSSQKGDDQAAIAELYLIDKDGQRISREPWNVMYADSENLNNNRTADKAYDLQESTYWGTGKDAKYPHQMVIDMGREYTLTGIQYLPRMEEGAPGSIKDYKLYIKKDNFKY